MRAVPRSGLRTLTALLLKGQRVDWKYSLVVIVVITGMFSTPLALGSIRNRVYTAVKAQIEKENNAREISVYRAREEAPSLDASRLAELRHRFPQTAVVGNHKLVVTVVGPEGSSFLTMETLTPGDPREASLRITPSIPEDFGLTDVVVSDTLGHLVYGDRWEDLWGANSQFDGDLLALNINDIPMEGAFQVVARRSLPGQGLYLNPEAGMALRRFSEGFGAPEFGLPVDEGLVRFALPSLATSTCLLLLEDEDPNCTESSRERLAERLRARQLKVQAEGDPSFPLAAGLTPMVVSLTQVLEHEGRPRVVAAEGNCAETLAPHLVEHCTAARIVPDVRLVVGLVQPEEDAESKTEPSVQLVGLVGSADEILPGASALRDQHGWGNSNPGGPIALTVPMESGVAFGEVLDLRVGETVVPGQTVAFYSCADGPCPVFAAALDVFRLHNVQQGTVQVQTVEPLVFVPTDTGEQYDEILVYAPTVEGVQLLAEELRTLFPGYSVQYNVAAIDKLRRQDSRLTTLFNLTLALSAIFIVLALAALAQINIERRQRQMAQMLILGFSRRFVRWLVVTEVLFLTLAASLAALGLTALLCAIARRILTSAAGDNGDRNFQVIIDSMSVDSVAFLLVFTIVAVCAWVVALIAARRAAQTDPLNLLD